MPDAGYLGAESLKCLSDRSVRLGIQPGHVDDIVIEPSPRKASGLTLESAVLIRASLDGPGLSLTGTNATTARCTPSDDNQRAAGSSSFCRVQPK